MQLNRAMTANILIVEDEALIACEMQAILEDGGYRCAGIASDLPAAVPYFYEPLDLALVDLNLRDGLTGPQIGARLSQAGVPVIFVTANPAQLGDGIAGTVGVLTKPTDENTLLAATHYALARRGRPAAAAVEEPPASLTLFG